MQRGAALKSRGEYCDTISGTTGKDEREALSRLLSDAFTRKFDTVVVYSIDRLGRSLKHCLEILETLKEHHCDFVSLQQQIDTASPTGQLIFNIFACLASYERTMILERTALGVNGQKRGASSSAGNRR